MIRIKVGGYTRISKTIARKRFDAGETVYLQRCNFWPVGGWATLCEVSKENSSYPTFDDLVSDYEYYNCTCNETGRYASFYVKEAK